MTLRRTQYKDAALTEFAGDVQAELAKLLPMRLVEFTEVYAEPMTVAIDPIPRVVLALDVRSDASPDSSIVGSARIDFTRTATGVRINDINGAVVGTKYRFTLLAVN